MQEKNSANLRAPRDSAVSVKAFSSRLKRSIAESARPGVQWAGRCLLVVPSSFFLWHGMRRDLLGRIQRVFLLISLLLLAVIGWLAAQNAGLSWTPRQSLARWLPETSPEPYLVLISGHAGSDSGAVCADEQGAVALTEAEVNADVAGRVVASLRQSGYRAELFDEFDPRLDGLEATLLVSLHADSCVGFSGYKAAHRAVGASVGDARLLACIDDFYPAATGLAYHPDTITRDMIGYHAFRKIAPSTPGVILEMGFLGGDRDLLTQGAARAAQGVVAAIECFLAESEASPTPAAP